MKAVAVPWREDFSFDADAFIARMKSEPPALVFIAYPNNPTGALYPEEDVLRVIRAAEGLVVLDEAYHVFAGKTFMQRLGEHPNLVVLRTVSKLGLAGIRLGYLAGRPQWIEQFDKVRSPYNLNVLTQTAALFLLDRLDVLQEQAARIRADRGSLAQALAALPGVTVYPSRGNFLLVRVPDPNRSFEGLRRQGVLVKSFNDPSMKKYLRITVGTP